MGYVHKQVSMYVNKLIEHLNGQYRFRLGTMALAW